MQGEQTVRISERDRQHVFWWSPPGGRFPLRRRENVGDHLSPVIVQRVLDGYRLRIADKRPGTGRLLAVGSILHFGRDGDVVWGSGVNGKVSADRYRFRRLDVRAARGPLTREFLRRRGISCPQIYGDPALLLPRLFPELEQARTGEREFVIIPHLHERQVAQRTGVDRRHVLSTTVGWRRFVQRVLESRFVLAGSLHGLIIAEAFGIPARLLRLSDGESLFKYEDYYLGTGRDGFRPASTVAEGLDLGGEPAPAFDADALLGAFPGDLWQP
jgi:pyruvyltransferase